MTALAADGKSDAYYDVTAVAERVPNGDTVYSIGSTSGNRSATVTNWNFDVVVTNLDNTTYVEKGMEVVSNTSFGASCEGDSGGPWFQITGATTAKFEGITSSGDTPLLFRTRPDTVRPIQCNSRSFFSPVAQIRIAYPNRVFQFTR